MQAGQLVISEVSEFTSRVIVNGVERDFHSWSVQRELSGDLPAQVSVMSGLVQATGTIVWVPDELADISPTHPLNKASGWSPSKGAPVQIFQGDGVSEWQVFEGVIDKSSGEIGEPGFQSRIIDHRDKLSKQFRHDPLLRIMPPLYRAEPSYRGVGLTYLYYVDAALRRAGFYAVPPSENRQSLSVPMQSSMWPEAGVMLEGTVGGEAGSGSWANTWNSVDGVAMSNVFNLYSPAVRLAYGSLQRLSVTVDPESRGNVFVTAYYGATDRVQLAVSPSRTVIARLNGNEVCRLVLGSATRVSLVIDGNDWELRTDQGSGITGSASLVTTATFNRVFVSATPDARIAGVHVCYPNTSTKWAYTEFVPSAQYRFDSLYLLGLMDAAPAITQGTCYDVLNEISDATISAMWIDETGVFQWAPSNVLSGTPPVRSLTTANDVLAMSWTDDLLSVRSEVSVTQRTPAITTSRWDNVLWHQGNRQSLESDQEINEFISPDSDTDWVHPSPAYLVYGEPGTGALSNRGHGSLVGAVLSTEDTEVNGSSYLTSSFEKINGDTYKLTHTVGSLPSGAVLEMRYATDAASIWPRWRGEAFPLIRGFGKVEWAETEVLADESGPVWAPPLEHDAGPWLARATHQDNTESASRLANYLQALTSREWPIVGPLEVQPDPRLQLGDRVTIRSEQYLGTVFSGIIVSLDRGMTPEGATMTLGLRMTTLESTYDTYASWNAEHTGTLTYEQWQALGPIPQTYAEFNDEGD